MTDHPQYSRFPTLVTAVATAAMMFVACSDPPTRPTAPALDPTTPVTVQPWVSRVRIEGPEIVPLGETEQFRLIGTMSDETEKDLTAEAEWAATDGDFVSMDQPGLMTGRARGQTPIVARLEHHNGWKLVMVMPAGTHRLAGYVRETGGGPNVADARVEVTNGVGAGLSTMTDYYGYYALFGVAGPTDVRVSKDGYVPTAADVIVTDNQWFELRLDVRRAHEDLAGVYTLRIAAAPECGLPGPQMLQAEARERMYAATIEQDRGRLIVSVASADGRHIRFGGRVEPDRATFEIQGPSHSDEEPQFFDRISDSRGLLVHGRVWVPLSRTRLEGNLSGTFQVFESGRPVATCTSTTHEFALSR